MLTTANLLGAALQDPSQSASFLTYFIRINSHVTVLNIQYAIVLLLFKQEPKKQQLH